MTHTNWSPWLLLSNATASGCGKGLSTSRQISSSVTCCLGMKYSLLVCICVTKTCKLNRSYWSYFNTIFDLFWSIYLSGNNTCIVRSMWDGISDLRRDVWRQTLWKAGHRSWLCECWTRGAGCFQAPIMFWQAEERGTGCKEAVTWLQRQVLNNFFLCCLHTAASQRKVTRDNDLIIDEMNSLKM